MRGNDSHLGVNSAILFNFLSCKTSVGSKAILIAKVEDAITTHLSSNKYNKQSAL